MTTNNGEGDGQGRSQRGFRSGGSAFPKAAVVPVCADQLFRSDGTTNGLATIVSLPELAECGPMISRIRVHWVVEGGSTNFSGKVQLQWSAIGRTWSTPFDLITAQVGNQPQVIGAWTNTDVNFGLHLQFLVTVANSSGTALETGRVTAFLEVEFKS